MADSTPETRPQAPGALGILQEFMNSGHLNAASVVTHATREEIRRRFTAGDSQATLAADYSLSQGFVSAILRRAPLDEELQPASAATAWLAERELFPPGPPLADDELPRLLAFRELLRLFVAANGGHGVEPAVIAELNAIAAAAPLVVNFPDAARPTLMATAPGAEGAIARLLALLFTTMHDGSWLRLKRCPGSGCPFTIYDSSRNRTGTWCSMSICGNRTKVRNYQQRRRAARFS